MIDRDNAVYVCHFKISSHIQQTHATTFSIINKNCFITFGILTLQGFDRKPFFVLSVFRDTHQNSKQS
jgi:hypothetical protein